MSRHIAVECSVCGARVHKKRITYTQELDGAFYIVKDVPAQVCGQCGEQYLDPDTVDALQDLVEGGGQRSARQETIEVPVYRFPQAVP